MIKNNGPCGHLDSKITTLCGVINELKEAINEQVKELNYKDLFKILIY